MRSIAIAPVVLALFSAAALSAAACGSTSNDAPAVAPAVTDDGGVDSAAAPPVEAGPVVDNGAPSTTYPATHPPLPELVNQAGGKVLSTPKVHLVVFPDYPDLAAVTGMATGVGATPYWTSAVSEYGIGPIAYDGVTELTGETAPATITDTGVEAYLNAKIAASAFGTPDPNTIYAIVYPKETVITLAGGSPFGPSQSCTSFGGYHGDTSVDVGGGVKQNIAFAVLPTCTTFGNLDELNGLTGAMSHELIEAVTDPFPSTNKGSDSAYGSVDQDHFIWFVLGGGGEAGDLCVPEANAFYKPTGFDYTVQRTWSNKLAKASHDPCAPNIAGTVYFNSAPVLKSQVTLDLSLLGSGPTQTQGELIAVGKSKVIEVDLFSDAATSGPWTVSAVDTVAKLTGQPPTLDFAWDRTSGVNGEKLHLTITVKIAATLVVGAHPFMITSKLGNASNTWPGLITDQ
jgi:hypothetical protein